MRPSELKKAYTADLLKLRYNIDCVQTLMQYMPGVSWNDKRTLELWLDQIDKAKQLKEG